VLIGAATGWHPANRQARNSKVSIQNEKEELIRDPRFSFGLNGLIFSEQFFLKQQILSFI